MRFNLMGRYIYIYMGRKLCFVGQKTNGTHFRLE